MVNTAEIPFVIVEAIFPGLTQLDFTGPHTVFSRLPNVKTIVASAAGGAIESDGGLLVAGTQRLTDIERCDLLFVPGGVAVTNAMNDAAFKSEIRGPCRRCPLSYVGLHRLAHSGCRWAFARTQSCLPLGLARAFAVIRRRD